MDRLLDTACTGPLFLRIPEIASMITDAIYHRDQCSYQLHAFVVMPNHVHLLITPLEPVSKMMQSLKRFISVEDGTGFWGSPGSPSGQDESYNRLVRDEREFERTLHYIESNPVTAGLAATPGKNSNGRNSARPIDNRPQVANLPHT